MLTDNEVRKILSRQRRRLATMWPWNRPYWSRKAKLKHAYKGRVAEQIVIMEFKMKILREILRETGDD